MSVHENLQLGPNQIRLLSVAPAAVDGENDLIHCSLEVVDLVEGASTPEYYALSYTWGSPAEYGTFKTMTDELNHPIMCQGKAICVTENLGGFLKRLRRTPWISNKKLWVDILCIDQQNLGERASQVKMMGRIFSSARTVIVWLGEEDEYTEAASSALKRISECIANNTLSHSPAYLRQAGSQLQLDHLSDRDAWLGVGKLFQRCYFIRSWTIQEVILAREVKTLCGGEQIEWDTLVMASKFFAETGWKVFLDNLAVEYPKEVPLPSYSHAPTMLYATRDDRSQQHWTTTLLYALERSRDFKATDPRDKVHCLLGLVEEYIKDKPLMDPVYGTRTAARTYTNAAIQLLEDGEDLYLLSCVEGEHFQRVGKLPSWVPDWTCGKSTGLLVAGYKRYSASGSMTQRPQIDHISLTLSLKGFKLDEVAKVGEAKHEVLEGEPFPMWLEIVASLPRWYREIPEEAGGENRLEAFWRTILRNTTGRPPKIIPHAYQKMQYSFDKWLQGRVAESSRHSGNPRWEALSRLYLELLDSSDATAPSDEESEKTIDPEDLDFETRLTWAKHLRLFRTRAGYLGLGSECVREGDSVWIIPSSRVPLIFRPISEGSTENNNRWRLVGGAYLHGVMNGEVLCPSCDGKCPEEIEELWQTIVIE